MILLDIVAVIVGAQVGAAQEVPLTFHEFTGAGQSYGGGYGDVAYDNRVPNGYAAPVVMKNPRFFTVSLGGGRPLVGVEGKSAPNLKFADLMWIDWNRDKAFEADEQLTPVGDRKPDSLLFIPKTWPVVRGKVVRLGFVASDGGAVEYVPAGYMGATIRLAGKDVKIGIIDSNLNGVFGDKPGGRLPGDELLIDRNGDGKFDREINDTLTTIVCGERLPLLPLMQLDGKSFFALDVSADGSTLCVKPYDGPIGEVSFPGAKHVTMLASGPFGPMWISAPAGTVALPVGTYVVVSSEYEPSDARGAGWTFMGVDRARRNLEIYQDKTIVAKCGPPFKFSLSVKKVYGGYRFNVELHDAGGVPLSTLRSPKNWWPEPHALKIRDAHGRTVDGVRLDFGRGFPCLETWLLGTAVKSGVYTVTAVWPAGPFGTYIARVKLNVEN